MGPADTDTVTDKCSWPIFLLIPIYLDKHIGHRYRYFSKADSWPISMLCSQYLADNDIADIYLADNRYRYPVCRYRYIDIGIGQIYRQTDITVYPYSETMRDKVGI